MSVTIQNVAKRNMKVVLWDMENRMRRDNKHLTRITEKQKRMKIFITDERHEDTNERFRCLFALLSQDSSLGAVHSLTVVRGWRSQGC